MVSPHPHVTVLENLYEGHGWKINLEEALLPDGRAHSAARVHRNDTAHILAFDDNGNVLMLREFRPFYGAYLWMIPSGMMDKENMPDVAAQRELREETGFRAQDLKKYFSIRNSEMLVQENHIFMAKNLVIDPLPQDDGETIECHHLSVEQAIANVLASPVIHTVSLVALLRYAREHGM
ncbi:MAG: NUDIX hydrolase [Candidatus Peregrinibacteria bacterium]